MPITAAVAVPHPPIILPEIGKGEEVKIRATTEAYRQAMREIAAARPETVVLFSPHADAYVDGFQISPGEEAWGDFARFGAPRSKVQLCYDQQLAAAIEQAANNAGIPARRAPEQNTELDHGSTIPLAFLQQQYTDFSVVRIGLSGLPLEQHYRLGQCIQQVVGEKNVAVIASGDLSHKLKEDGPYGFAPEGPQLDAAITKALGSGAFDQLLAIDEQLADTGAECGLRAFVMMAGTLDGTRVEAKLLSYEGPFGVGYAVASFAPAGADDSRRFLDRLAAARHKERLARQDEEDAYVALARYSLESYLASGKRVARPSGLPGEMLEERAGVFVSLHKDDQLRGCIGTIAPTTGSVADEILQNAISAACEDPRFAPVQKEELDALTIHVDVLGAPEEIDGPEALDVKRYGVIVSKGMRRGLLLPDLDGVDTVEAQVAIARQKAGIAPEEEVRLERFEVIRHE